MEQFIVREGRCIRCIAPVVVTLDDNGQEQRSRCDCDMVSDLLEMPQEQFSDLARRVRARWANTK